MSLNNEQINRVTNSSLRLKPETLALIDKISNDQAISASETVKEAIAVLIRVNQWEGYPQTQMGNPERNPYLELNHTYDFLNTRLNQIEAISEQYSDLLDQLSQVLLISQLDEHKR